LIQVKRMPNGAIEEWWDGKPAKTIYDYEEQKAAKALKAATEATALLKRQNERAEDDIIMKKIDREHRNRAEAANEKEAREKEARDAESRNNRSNGYYSILQDAGSKNPEDYSAVREQEARVNERYKKWEEETERTRQAEAEAKEARDKEAAKKWDEEKRERAPKAEANQFRGETAEDRRMREHYAYNRHAGQ
jgi:hypothetical protein